MELISNYSMVAIYKVNIEKSVVSLYLSNEKLKFKIKIKEITTIIKMKYFGINLTKHVQNLHAEPILLMSIIPKLANRLKIISINISANILQIVTN